jgi:hypothetical protein
MTIIFTVARNDLRQTRWIAAERGALADGGVRVRIDSFSLTSNNITYAAFGEAMKYWSFFPTGDAAMGCIPVWGFGTVVESRCSGVPVGERYYGYFPIADDVDLFPARVNAEGFLDGAPHRRDLHTVYNHYVRCSADPLYQQNREAEQALLRPLFTTSFLIDDFLADNGFFGARNVLLSSASSKTAYGTAFCLARRRGSEGAPNVIGLTSPANVVFTRRLGCYDDVRTYDALKTLSADVPTVYVDMSGSVGIRASVHTHFGERLAYSCSVGGTHWDEIGSAKGLAGPRPVLFFAPAQIAKRRTDWGPDGLAGRIAEAWHSFVVAVTAADPPWLRVVRGAGRAAVESVYLALLNGRSSPEEGHVLTLRTESSDHAGARLPDQ